MRKIKFRAYDPETGKMYEVRNISFDGRPTVTLEYGPVYKVPMDEVYLMQYVGIEDSNNAEIYDGDILKISDGVETTYEMAYFGIDKIENYPAYTLTNLEWKFSANPFSEMLGSTANYEFVVVGNIHENPELLKKQISNR